MMRAVIALALAGGLLAAPAVAQTTGSSAASQRLELIGTAPAACVISTPRASNAINATYAPAGANAGLINITQFVDLQTAQPRPSSIELTLPVICNGAHHVTISSTNGGLTRGGATVSQTNGGPFAEFLSYDLGIDWIGRTVNRASDQGATDIASDQPGNGEFVIRVATADHGTPLVAGQYSDSIVIEFQPAN